MECHTDTIYNTGKALFTQNSNENLPVVNTYFDNIYTLQAFLAHITIFEYISRKILVTKCFKNHTFVLLALQQEYQVPHTEA